MDALKVSQRWKTRAERETDAMTGIAYTNED